MLINNPLAEAGEADKRRENPAGPLFRAAANFAPRLNKCAKLTSEGLLRRFDKVTVESGDAAFAVLRRGEWLSAFIHESNTEDPA